MNREVENFYIADTSQAMRNPGGRDLNDYEQWCGFNKDELNGKKILDLGSGPFEKLDAQLRANNILSEVWSINPDYSLKKYRKIINNQETWSHRSVAALAQNLPFPDETFDKVYGLTSITYYVEPNAHPSEALKWMSEICRVLRKGGEAVLTDIPGMKSDSMMEAYNPLFQEIEKNGLTYRIEEFKIRETNPKPRFRLRIEKPF